MKGFLINLNFIFALLLISAPVIYGQPGGKWVNLFGKVTNETLNSPISAKITLESLPDGADNRIFYSNEETGDFKFKVKENSKYKVKVESEGYITIDREIEAIFGMDSLMIKLMPTGSGTVLRLNINFGQNSAEILEESFSELDRLVAMLIEYPKMEIQLEGHTDFRGSQSANLRLSEERVIAVKKYLTDHDIESPRLQTKAFGGTLPVRRENTEEAKLMNRRVEARILKTD